MAKCDEGYRCEVCGRDVEAIPESDLYLRFVLGEVPLETLHRLPERHIACNPALAQYIVDPDFPPVACDGPFAKAGPRPGVRPGGGGAASPAAGGGSRPSRPWGWPSPSTR